MSTTIYFVRHAEPDKTKFSDEMTCPLTPKGQEDCIKVTEFLRDKSIDIIFSSPYKRSVDTIAPFAQAFQHDITIINDLREWYIGGIWIDCPKEYENFIRKSWGNPSAKIAKGESLTDLQNRNIAAILDILKNNSGKNIVIGTHGMALSTIINHYDKTFGCSDFLRIARFWPWIVRMDFDEKGDFITWKELLGE